MNHTHLSAKSKNAGNPVRAGLKRNKPSPLTLEPRLMFDAAAVSEGTLIAKDVAHDNGGNFLYSFAVSTASGDKNVDHNLFDTQNGNLVFKNAPDYEAPKDVGKDNVYYVQVIRTGRISGNETTIDYKITVTNREGDPDIKISPDVNIDENKLGNSLVFSASSTMKGVKWSLGGADASAFSISTNGDVKIKESADYETKSSYLIDVIATKDGVPSTKSVVIAVNDVNERPLFDDDAPRTVWIDENVATDVTIYKAAATDPDDGDAARIKWSLTGKDSDKFSINTKGEVTINKSPNYEDPSNPDHSYNFNIVATDGRNSALQDTQEITVKLRDIEEPTIIDGPKVGDKITITLGENDRSVTSDPSNKLVVTDGDGPAKFVTGPVYELIGNLAWLGSDAPIVGKYGTLEMRSDGSWTYTMNKDVGGDSMHRGEVIEETFKVMAYEDSKVGPLGYLSWGTIVTKEVTIQIIGENDIPTVKIIDVRGDIVEGSKLTDSGSISFSDLDLSDRPQTTEALKSIVAERADGRSLSLTDAQKSAIENAFSVALADGSTNNGTINWNYNVAETSLNFLAQGEKITAVFTVTVDDRNGGKATQDVTINITGTNDAPSVAASDVTGAVTERTGTPSSTDKLADTGRISFSDADLTDIHTVSAVRPVVDTVLGSPLGTLTASVTKDSTGTGSGGVVTWNYSVDASKVEYLAKGQTKIEKFSFDVSDGKGGSVERTVSVTITGTNDAPIITVGHEDSSAAERNETDQSLTASGTLTVGDVDRANTVRASVQDLSVRLDGRTVSVDGRTYRQLFEMLSVNSSVIDASSTTGTINWSFDSSREHFDFLAKGQTLTLAYTVRATDNSGAPNNHDDQSVAITIHGTNDAPVANNDRGNVIEDGGTGRFFYNGVLTNDTDVDSVLLSVSAIRAGSESHSGTNSTVEGFGTTIAGQYGTLTIDPWGGYFYTANNADRLAGGEQGTDTFTYTVRDSMGATDTGELVFTVTGTNDAPKIDLRDVDKPVNAIEDVEKPITGIRVSDVDSKWLMTTVSVAHGQLTIGDYSEPDLPSDDDGPYEPRGELSRITSDDGFGRLMISGNGSGSITLFGTADQINEALSQLTYLARADYNGRDTLTVTTSDRPGPIKPSMSDGPYYTTARVSEGDGPGHEGPEKHSVSKSIRIIVAPVADIADDTASTRQNTAVTIDVNANDSFENERHHITRINGERFGKDGLVVVDNGVVTLNEDGTLSFTPNAGFYGDASFTYTVRSGGVIEIATVTVTVIPDAATRSMTGGESGVGGITGAYVPGGGSVLGVSGFRGDLSGTRVPGQSDAPSGDAGGGFNPNALLNNAPTAAGFGEGDLSEFLPFELAMMDLSGKDDFAVFLPAGEKASFALPADMLQGPQAVDFAVFQANGEPLPDWLVFDPITGKFLGKAPEGMHGTVRIQLTGRDAKGIERVIRISVNVDAQERGALAERMTPDRDARLVVAESTIAVRGNGRPGLSDQLQSARRGLSSERLARVVSAATMAKL